MTTSGDSNARQGKKDTVDTSTPETLAPLAARDKVEPATLASERLNSKCFCITLNEDALQQGMTVALKSPAIAELVEERCSYLFSAHPVFISDDQTERIASVVRAVESVVALPAYRDRVLADAPAIARHDPGGAKGVFFGYDFHVRDNKIGLIEINTNAGGAMLNAVMAKAHRACCVDTVGAATAAISSQALEKDIVDMFFAEWRLSGRDRPLQTIGIVDAVPEEQYLYPEFLLFKQLFERHGLRAVIADPSALQLHDGVLWHHDTAIDLVYNRLTDFMLELPASAALRAAYIEHAVVLTPHPQALYADKRNLAVLCDAEELEALGVARSIQDILLANIQHTEVVDVAHADRLWSERRRLFFKPTDGYGGRAAYRGDKITKRVWDDIRQAATLHKPSWSPGKGSSAAARVHKRSSLTSVPMPTTARFSGLRHVCIKARPQTSTPLAAVSPRSIAFPKARLFVNLKQSQKHLGSLSTWRVKLATDEISHLRLVRSFIV